MGERVCECVGVVMCKGVSQARQFLLSTHLHTSTWLSGSMRVWSEHESVLMGAALHVCVDLLRPHACVLACVRMWLRL